MALEAGTAVDQVPRHILGELRDLVGADEAEYFEFRRADRAVIASAQSHDWPDAPGSVEAMVAFGYQNPLGWHRWLPANGPMRLSTQMSRRALERLQYYQEVLRPNALTDNLKIWLRSDERSVACIQLWQRGSTFSQRQEDLLGVLQHHLARASRRAPDGESVPAGEAWITRREAEVLTCAMRGESDDAIAERLGMATGTVGKHLENAFAKLGVHSRAEALWRVSAADGSSRGGGTPHAAQPLGSVAGTGRRAQS
jgi:DNA-binding CsgD family transcriptional regulator